MSSMRNAVQRRNHKERAQPLERQKWGHLEKHKDYALRAKDFNAKKARLRALREKASQRNPDEFSFGMMSSRSKGGVKVADRGNKTLTLDVVKLLKTQDAGYMRTMLQSIRKDRERLEESLILNEDEITTLKSQATPRRRKGVQVPKHTVFVDEKDEQREFVPEEWFGVADEQELGRAWNRRRVGGKAEGTEEDKDEEVDLKSKKPRRKQEEELDKEAWLEEKERHRARILRELESLKAKEEALRTASEELDTQRAKMNNQLGGVNKSGVKWKVRARKR